MAHLPLIIINPTSAGGTTGRVWPQIAADLRAHFGAFTPAFTKGVGDGRLLARRAAQEGHRLIVACGGDGTINEVGNGILESGADAELGVLPSGTGGDFRRTLNLGSDAASAALTLRDSQTRRIDVGRVTYLDTQGNQQTRFFLNVASCGMGSHVIKRVKEGSTNSSRELSAARRQFFSGRLAFASAALRTAVSFEKPSIIIGLDEKRASRITIANLCIANARYFGGGMKIAPQAKLNDGQLDVVAIGDLSALTMLTDSYRLYLGTHLGINKVHHAHAKRITARPADERIKIDLEVDGELVGQLPATFEVIPQALRLRTT